MVISYSAALSAPLLSVSQERSAIDRWQQHGDKDSLELLIRSHARQVYACAMKSSRDPILIEDLFAEGVVGLIKAVEGFDLSRHVRFSTYARWWIINSVGGAAAQLKSVVSSPKLSRRTKAEPGFDEIDIYAGTSLDLPDGNNSKGSDEIVASLDPTPEEYIIEKSKNRWLSELVNESLQQLNALERDVIVSRNLNSEPDSFADLAKRLGFSRDHLRKVERRALSRLRFDLLEKGVFAQGFG